MAIFHIDALRRRRHSSQMEHQYVAALSTEYAAILREEAGPPEVYRVKIRASRKGWRLGRLHLSSDRMLDTLIALSPARIEVRGKAASPGFLHTLALVFGERLKY